MVTHFRIDGLNTAVNEYAAPGGTISLSRADNCVFLAPNRLGPRRGLARKSYTFGGSDRADALIYFGGTLYVHHGETVSFDTGSAFTALPTEYARVDATRKPRFLLAAESLYINTATGQKEIGAGDIQAGMARPLGLSGTPSVLASSNWQTSNSAVAYQAILTRVNEAGKTISSAPSGRAVIRNDIRANVGGLARVSNTVTFTSVGEHHLSPGEQFNLEPGEANFAAATYTVATAPTANTFTYVSVAADATSTLEQRAELERGTSIRVYLPPGPAGRVQLYRSDELTPATGAPSDDLFLAYDGPFDSSDVTAGYIDIDDATPEDFLGAPLYTNPNTGAGAESANFPPPLCIDACNWDGRTWYANTTGKQRAFFEMVGIGSPDGVQADDTVTVWVGDETPVVFTFKASPSGDTEVQLYTSYASAALNIEATARALMLAINAEGSTGVNGYYLSGEDEKPGKMLLEAEALGSDTINVLFSRAASWSPVGSLSSGNDRAPNRLMYAKPGEPEHVPLLNYLDVGDSSAAILRVMPLKTTLLVFKEDGIWSVSGTFPYVVEKTAETKLVGYETPVLLADRVWCLSDQGWVAVSGSGVAALSLPIEDKVQGELFAPATLDDVREDSFAVGYETARMMLGFVPDDDDTVQAQVYSTRASQWTRWPDVNATCGVVSPDDMLVLGAADAQTVLVERKTLDETDFADDGESTNTFSSIDPYPPSGFEVAILPYVGAEPGDRLVQGALTAVVTASESELIDGDLIEFLTLDTEGIPWGGAATLYRHIPVSIRLNPFTAGDPSSAKHLGGATWLFKEVSLARGIATVLTDITPLESETTLTFDGFSNQSWGDSYWGSPELSARLQPLVPLPKGYESGNLFVFGLDIAEAWAKWSLVGITIDVVESTSKARR